MRLALLVGVLLGLAGCSSFEGAEVKRCEDQLVAKLKAPASYKRVSMHVTDINPDNPGDLRNPTQRWVTIEYDAVNSFNAPLRGTEICRFPLKNGEADEWNMIEDEPAVENIEAETMPDLPVQNTVETNTATPIPEADDDAPANANAIMNGNDAELQNESYD